MYLVRRKRFGWQCAVKSHVCPVLKLKLTANQFDLNEKYEKSKTTLLHVFSVFVIQVCFGVRFKIAFQSIESHLIKRERKLIYLTKIILRKSIIASSNWFVCSSRRIKVCAKPSIQPEQRFWVRCIEICFE